MTTEVKRGDGVVLGHFPGSDLLLRLDDETHLSKWLGVRSQRTQPIGFPLPPASLYYPSGPWHRLCR